MHNLVDFKAYFFKISSKKSTLKFSKIFGFKCRYFAKIGLSRFMGWVSDLKMACRVYPVPEKMGCRVLWGGGQGPCRVAIKNVCLVSPF